MNEFRTQFTGARRYISHSGDRIVPVYSLVYDDDGKAGLKEVGKTDLYSSIQSHRDSCDIHVLLKRYANGDVDALSRVQGVYADFTQAPKTFADMLNLVNAGHEYFDSLPVDVKQQYNNNFAEFMADFGSKEFIERMGFASFVIEKEAVGENKEVSE